VQHIYVSFMHFTLFEWFYFFCWWSLFGWFLEVIVRTLETGGFENRGFLNGPFCPIYGFGVSIILKILSPLEDHLILLYITSAIMCSSFELFVGVLMQKLFHAKWWDYSEEKFNFKGFICLRITLLWGVGSVMVLKVVNPVVMKVIGYLPLTAGNITAILIMIVVIIDLAATLSDIRNFNMRLKQVDAIAKLLHDKSIALGENISDEVLSLDSKYERLAEQIKSSRLVRAFPSMIPSKYAKTFKAIKNPLSGKFNINDYYEKYESKRLLINTPEEEKNKEDK